MAESVMMRDVFGKALAGIGKEFPDVVVVDADLANGTKSGMFRDEFPDRFFQVGVAEQNMVGVAAGLAYAGFIPFAVTYACFLCKRGLDQIRVLIAQPEANVKLIGCYSGLSAGLNGKSHQSVQDTAIMRSMPNMVVVEPLDVVEMAAVLQEVASRRGPAYVRLIRGPSPVIFPADERFSPGKAIILRQGTDVTLIGSGTQTAHVLEAAGLLKEQGIDACVLHVSWIKPLDEQAVVNAARQSGIVVTVEEHNVIGGLGSAVTEVLSEHCPVPVKRLGIRDSFGRTGSLGELRDRYGLSPAQIAAEAREFMRRNSRSSKRKAPRAASRVCA